MSDGRLSRSPLWDAQRDFFTGTGHRAWTEGIVPHYITNNPFIGRAYARFVERVSGAGTGATVHVIELGAGPGAFAFYFLKSIRRPGVRYVLTDLVPATVAGYRSRPELRPFFDSGTLVAGTFDIEGDGAAAVALDGGDTLDLATLDGPVIVICNYLFDSLRHDAFTVRGGQVLERRVAVTGRQSAAAEVGLDDVTISHRDSPIDPDYYGEPARDGLLQRYRLLLGEAAFLLPVGAFDLLDRLSRSVPGPLVVLAGDKGHATWTELADSPAVNVVHHGSVSMMVNFDALGEYVRRTGGRVVGPEHSHPHLHTIALAFGPVDPGLLQSAHEDLVTPLSPGDFFVLKKLTESRVDAMTTADLLAFLRLSGWDPNVFLSCADALRRAANVRSDSIRTELLSALRHVWANHYSLTDAVDLAFELGLLAFDLGDPAEALRLFQRSLDGHGADPGTYFNIALCHLQIGDRPRTVASLRQAIGCDPHYAPATDALAELSA